MKSIIGFQLSKHTKKQNLDIVIYVFVNILNNTI